MLPHTGVSSGIVSPLDNYLTCRPSIIHLSSREEGLQHPLENHLGNRARILQNKTVYEDFASETDNQRGI